MGLIRHVIPDGVRPIAVERYIRRAWPMIPAHALRAVFDKRDVKRAGQRLGRNDSVAGGDELVIFLPDRFLPGPAECVFDDGRLIAAAKPQGLPVDVDQDGIGADTLLSRLQAVHPSAQLCHRLDAATGGLVLAAVDDETLARALETFRVHALRKRYLALTAGGFAKREGVLRAWLTKDARQSLVRVSDRETRGAKPIETRYRVLGEENGVARVELEPVTGRTHQLRAHMAHFGHPLLGDDKYGDRARNRSVPELRLWCASLEITEDSPLVPYRGMRFEAPLPEWWIRG